MTSAVEICNLALSEVHQTSFNSFDDTSRQAQVCNLWYEITRDQVLSTVDWNFNKKIRALSLLDEEVFNWAYVYQYPSDCLHINHIIPNIQTVSQASVGSAPRARYEDLPNIKSIEVPYETLAGENDSKVIVANYDDLHISYRSKVENPSFYSPSFVTALVHMMAANIAIPIAGPDKGRGFREDSLKLYTQLVDDAAIQSENENYQTPPESDLISVRG